MKFFGGPNPFDTVKYLNEQCPTCIDQQLIKSNLCSCYQLEIITNILKWKNKNKNEIYFCVHALLYGVLHLPPLQVSMFCALFQNHQHLFEKKYMHPIVNCPRNSKIASKFR